MTGKLIVDLKRSNNSNFNELWLMLSRCSESFAQRNFYGNLEIIFIKINEQKLNLFEGLAHGEKLFCLRSTFKEVKCMSSK